MAAITTPPLLFRALHRLAESGYNAEADSAFVLCCATQWCEPLARGTRHLDFRHGRSRLEYNVRVGCRQRMGWLVDRGGAEARVWDEEGARRGGSWRCLIGRPWRTSSILRSCGLTGLCCPRPSRMPLRERC